MASGSRPIEPLENRLVAAFRLEFVCQGERRRRASSGSPRIRRPERQAGIDGLREGNAFVTEFVDFAKVDTPLHTSALLAARHSEARRQRIRLGLLLGLQRLRGSLLKYRRRLGRVLAHGRFCCLFLSLPPGPRGRVVWASLHIPGGVFRSSSSGIIYVFTSSGSEGVSGCLLRR